MGKKQRNSFGSSIASSKRRRRAGEKENDDGVDLATKVNRGFSLLDDSTAGGISLDRRVRSFPNQSKTQTSVATPVSRHSRFSRTTNASPSNRSMRTKTRISSVHVVCAVAENLARETAVASLDALSSPDTVLLAKQANGQLYAETIAYLENLQPVHEILLNEGRRHSPLANKIMELFGGGDDVAQRAEYEVEATAQRHPQTPYSHTSTLAPKTHTVVKFLSRALFDQTRGAELLRKVTGENDAPTTTDFVSLSSTHALLAYIQTALGAQLTRVRITTLGGGGAQTARMDIDRRTVAQLELLTNAVSPTRKKHSLLATINHTRTTVGGRLLRTNLQNPPAVPATVTTRQELVDAFLGHADFFYATADALTSLPDLDRLLATISLVRHRRHTNGKNAKKDITPRQASRGIAALVGLQQALQALPPLVAVLRDELERIGLTLNKEASSPQRSDRSTVLGIGLGDDSSLRETNSMTSGNKMQLLVAVAATLSQPVLRTLQETVSASIRPTAATHSSQSHVRRHQECFALPAAATDLLTVLRRAFLSNVDEIYRKADEYAEVHELQVQVRYGTQRGYYLAVSGTDNLPASFLQASKNGRFITCTTEEISSLNLRAIDNMHDLLLMTREKVHDVLEVAREHYDALAAVGDAVALLDLCHSFADHVTLANQKWSRPVVTDNPASSLIIRGGRFAILPFSGAEYVGNDTYSAPNKPFTIITGINGSGKTTYLHQIAMIFILAQCGSYVPAEQACIPVRSQLCCRMGNTDDQEHNISTFLLEMKETAYICNTVSARSLVLVDELGRATSNEDGVAIAWAFSEYLLKKRALTLCVTHYPQLVRLRDTYPHAVQNVHLAATITRGGVSTTANPGPATNNEISYTHQLRPGACPVAKDYGVALAAACGWPAEVVDAATQIHTKVAGLMPEFRLCENREPSLANRACGVVQSLQGKLSNLTKGSQMLSMDDLRSRMLKLRDEVVGDDDREALVEAVSQLLLVDDPSRKGDSHGRSRGHVGKGNPRDNHVDDINERGDNTSISSSSSSSSSSESSDSSSSSSSSSGSCSQSNVQSRNEQLK